MATSSTITTRAADAVLSERQAAAQTAIGRTTIQLMRTKGQLPAVYCVYDGDRFVGYTPNVVDYLTRPLDPAPTILGITPSAHAADASHIMEYLKTRQASVEHRIARKARQVVNIGDTRPICIAFMADMHLGDSFTDYIGLERDACLIRDTPGMYGVWAGDYVDNWVTSALQWVQRHQPIPHAAEWQLFKYIFGIVRERMVAVCAGNHDNRTDLCGGVDMLEEILQGANLLYDQNEILFDVVHAGHTRKFKVRHKWRGRAKTNPTHGIEDDLRFGSDDWDVGVGGHTHNASLFREFVYKERMRVAVQIGTYKMADHYGEQCGFPKMHGTGSLAMILYPDGGHLTVHSIERAAQILTMERMESRG